MEAEAGAGLTEFIYVPRTEPSTELPRDDTATVSGTLRPLRANESCIVSWTTSRFKRRTPERVIQQYGDVDVMAAYDLPLLVLTLRFDKPPMIKIQNSYGHTTTVSTVAYYEHYEVAPGSGMASVVRNMALEGPVRPWADGIAYTHQFSNVRKLHHYGMTWFY